MYQTLQAHYKMKINLSPKLFFKKYVTFPDRVLLGLILTNCIIALVLTLVNYFTANFQPIPLTSALLKPASLIFFTFMIFYGMYAKNETPRGATFIWGFGLYGATLISIILTTASIETTPFPLIDKSLLYFNELLGINIQSVVAWVHSHTLLHHILSYAYESLGFQLIFIPLGLMCFNARKTLGVFYITTLIITIIGVFIYYFFPTLGPSGVIHSPFLPVGQADLPVRFYEIHHYLPITVHTSGLIAFPSFHVIWATQLTYACKNKKYIFYPILLLNSILIASTVLLGWHYIADVIAGFIIVTVTLYLAEKCYSTNH